MHHDGFVFHAAAVTLAPKLEAASGPCVDHTTSASLFGTSGTKNCSTPACDSQRNPFYALIDFNPGGAGYPCPRSLADCPTSGEKASTYIKPTTFGLVPACVITMPPQEWPTSSTGPFCRSRTRFVAATSSSSDVNGFCTAVTV